MSEDKCPECSFPLTSGMRICPRCRVKLIQKCARCPKEVTFGSFFCLECKQKATQEADLLEKDAADPDEEENWEEDLEPAKLFRKDQDDFEIQVIPGEDRAKGSLDFSNFGEKGVEFPILGFFGIWFFWGSTFVFFVFF